MNMRAKQSIRSR